MISQGARLTQLCRRHDRLATTIHGSLASGSADLVRDHRGGGDEGAGAWNPTERSVGLYRPSWRVPATAERPQHLAARVVVVRG